MVRGTAREDTLAVLNGGRPWDRGQVKGEKEHEEEDWERIGKKSGQDSPRSGGITLVANT